MTEGGTKRRREPRLLIPGGEALRRVQKSLACDAEAAMAWLKLQVMRTALQVYAGIHPLAYHPKDTSDRAKAAPETSRYPIAAADIVGDGAFDWSMVSVDERHLKNALAAEHADPDQLIDGGDPPRPSVPFAVAVEMTKKVSGFSEEAARAWLRDALFVNPRIPAWCQPTQRYPAWRRATAWVDLSLVYVMESVLEQALATEFPRMQHRPTSLLGAAENKTGEIPERPAEPHKATKRRKPGALPKNFTSMITAAATVWACDEGIDPDARGSLQRVRDYMSEWLSDREMEDDASPETIRQWATAVLEAVRGPKG